MLKETPCQRTIGNIFFTLFAGHETIGNTLAFILLLLSVYPEWQRRIHQQIDDLSNSGPKDGSPESYEKCYAHLKQGPLEAVIKETLRLYNVVQMVWRHTSTTVSMTDSEGVSHVLPEGMLCMINFSAAHQSPAKWPQTKGVTAEQRADLHDSPAIDFDPGRWLDGSDTSDDTEDGVPFCWPFSQGVRSCPGRGFAGVEMTAVLFTILKDYRLLLIDTDDVSRTVDDTSEHWKRAQDHGLRMLVDGVRTNMNIEMVGELPVRLVPCVVKTQR